MTFSLEWSVASDGEEDHGENLKMTLKRSWECQRLVFYEAQENRDHLAYDHCTCHGGSALTHSFLVRLN